MNEFIDVLASSGLFAGIAPANIASILHCLSAREQVYERNDFILHTGDHVDSIGLLLSGSVHIIREDFWGNRNINAELNPGDVFAESYACMPAIPVSIEAIAVTNARVLFLNVRRVMTTCSPACEFHSTLIHNLLTVLASKNIRMNEKLEHVTQRNTREKLLSYMSAQARRSGSPAFDIPFNRQQLADYLAVDRSAMSSELGRMRDEGLLKFERNHFELLQST